MWLNRDPIGERGDSNLYGFCANDGVNHIDLFGLDTYFAVELCSIDRLKASGRNLCDTRVMRTDIRDLLLGEFEDWHREL